MADGFGPLEASVADDPEPDRVPRPNREPAAIAEQFAPDRRATAAVVIDQAPREFPDFEDIIMKPVR
ncbi:hypothetical protein [Streptomyces sp. NPDC051665]|uniref:hypothetical protein n=1 Tax=Streptomyces sp. NPDC051665 TaxID=3154647 RepID=UPI003430A82F